AGTESDIQAAGGLDHPEEVLASLDVVIASVHGRFRLDQDAMTERLLTTIDLPNRMVWGHPLGRLVLSRPPIEADLDRVFDRIAEKGHIIEVNGDPHRMDLPPQWIRAAKKRGIRMVLSADAHSVRGLEMAKTAVDCARVGGLEPADVLNTRPAEAFMAAVDPRRSS
ncbi:MAG: DNA polymerase/3'-5' exonuclease PolX, partial [Myxococcota bacterium]